MKWIKSITAVILVVLLIVVLNHAYNSSDNSTTGSTSVIDTVIFPHDEVVEANIEIDEDTYAEMLNNATAEEIVMADITYNGNTFENVGIRPKGNSSLRDVFQSDSDRYSFKVDFNYYLDDQNFYGITKLNLNNIFSDPSMMAEYLGYEMLDSLDAVSSRTTYVKLSINGEYFGLYLAVEQVNEEFLNENYSNSDGDLYKPDQGTGSDLAYISDDGTDYTGLFPENADNSDNAEITELIKTIENGGDLDSIFDVDSFLKYLAVSTMTIHQDSYQGGMFHNYYLYDNNGIFEWISWDLNMIFNGFPGTNMTDEQAIAYLIDEPVSGSMENYPLIQAIFENEENIEKYHEYLQILSEGYLEKDTFNEKVLSVYDMIKSYVETDPTSFFTYEQFENGLFQEDGTQLGILAFAEQRLANVAQQLSGEIPSTNNGAGNASSSKGSGMTGGKMQGRAGVVDDQLFTDMDGKTPDEIIEIIINQMGSQVTDDMKEQIIQKFEGLTSDEMIALMQEEMGGQMSEATTQDATGQLPARDGKRTPPDGVTEGNSQITPPDSMTGQVPEGDSQGAPPESATEGQIPEGKTQGTPSGDITEEKTTEIPTEASSEDIIVLLGLTGVLIALSFIIRNKH